MYIYLKFYNLRQKKRRKMMKNFNDIYEEVYKKCQRPLERLRIEEKNKKIRICVFIVIVVIFLNIYFRGCSLGIYALLFSIMLFTILLKPGKKYNYLFKENVIKTFVKAYSENLKYDQNKGIGSIYYREGEFENFDRFSSEDGIWGVLQDIYNINMAEVHTERRDVDEKGRVSYTTLFYGLFAQVEFDKFILGKIKLRRNSMIKLSSSKTRLTMDSGEFEKIYDVYSTDKIITMQIFTADVMQMFLDFKEKNKMIPELTIKGNKLYIRFNTGNLFEANVFKSALDYSTLQRYFNTINFTLEITEKIVKNIKETEI